MTSIITAALMLCSTGDPVIAEKIAMEAVRQDTNIVVAVTIGIMESGLGRKSHDNPMGVRGCYPEAKKKHKRTTDDCIRIGVTSIHNRLWDAYVTSPRERGCSAAESGNIKNSIPTCVGLSNAVPWSSTMGLGDPHISGVVYRALVVYNGANRGRKYVYAKKAMGIIRRIYKIMGTKVPNT